MQKSNTIISSQIESIRESLSLYNVSLENDSDEKLTILVKGIISVKIFSNCSEEDNYIKEIISNLNQFSILSFLGFRVASMVLLRRCLENVLSSIYYREHKIEYIKKELDSDKRNFNKIDDLLNYFIEYPYTHFYINGKNYIRNFLNMFIVVVLHILIYITFLMKLNMTTIKCRNVLFYIKKLLL